MLSVFSILSALVLAQSAAANPVARSACNPTLAGFGISIGSGSFEVGYSSSVAGAPLITQTLTTTGAEYIAETSTITNGGFVLK
jgi:hypothetical protein